MRILWVNPVGTADHDAPIAARLERARSPGTVAEVVSFAPGSAPGHREHDGFEAVAAPHVVRPSLQAAAEGWDAIQDRLGVPVIDAVRAPFRMAEHLAGQASSFGWSPGRAAAGLAPGRGEVEAAACLGPATLGNRIEVR